MRDRVQPPILRDSRAERTSRPQLATQALPAQAGEIALAQAGTRRQRNGPVSPGEVPHLSTTAYLILFTLAGQSPSTPPLGSTVAAGVARPRAAPAGQAAPPLQQRQGVTRRQGARLLSEACEPPSQDKGPLIKAQRSDGLLEAR